MPAPLLVAWLVASAWLVLPGLMACLLANWAAQHARLQNLKATRPTASKAQGARPHISKVPTLRHGGASKRDPKGSRPLRHKVTKAIGSKPSASKSKAQRFKLHFYSFMWNVSSRAAPFACKSLAILRGVCHHAFLRGVWFCPGFGTKRRKMENGKTSEKIVENLHAGATSNSN